MDEGSFGEAGRDLSAQEFVSRRTISHKPSTMARPMPFVPPFKLSVSLERFVEFAHFPVTRTTLPLRLSCIARFYPGNRTLYDKLAATVSMDIKVVDPSFEKLKRGCGQ